MKKIAILGCGWLGQPLAKSLIGKGFTVSGSTTTVDKLAILEKFNIKPFLITLSEDKITGDFDEFLQGNNILIIDIPPKLRGANKENFVRKIANCIPYIEKLSIEKIIFISSTSVFEDNNSIVTDDTIPNATSESGKQLLAVEQLLQKNTHFETTVIRFGGLVGADRHPAKMLAGRSDIENPDGVINLIHQQDCVAIIEKVIEKNFWSESINAVSPFHPTRESYYTQKAAYFGLAPPTFDHSKPSVGKLVVVDKVDKILGHRFLWTDVGFEFTLSN